ncbi:DgyrCDS4820 [Dimorphilus gyrociliatus]|uniref:DgyrCDS4820 n=1 Tax=Dimorphilus gyrociliatus TaxID=2664684 RepID=A0A7I8VHQ7_9ANNE|nr:DgyrCDS4820 [Dimorphilus gyrociliatus]
MDLSMKTKECNKGKRRRNRTIFSEKSIKVLEEAFNIDPYPDFERREMLADETGIAEARIQTWFQNKRSRAKRTTKQPKAIKRPTKPESPRNVEVEKPTQEKIEKSADIPYFPERLPLQSVEFLPNFPSRLPLQYSPTYPTVSPFLSWPRAFCDLSTVQRN